jgi:large subunit ribosomal protein L25
MKRISLSVDQRDETGKGPARRLRAVGKVPAVLYGKKREPLKLAVEVHGFKKILEQSGTNVLFDLQIGAGDDASATRIAMLKERQAKPTDGSLIHLDFQEILMDEPIEVTIPVHFEGKPLGVDKNGMFQPAVRELRVSCLPNDIPSAINIDVSALDLGHSIHVGEITFPAGVTPAQDLTLAVASVLAPKKEEEAAAAEEPAAAEPAPAKKEKEK